VVECTVQVTEEDAYVGMPLATLRDAALYITKLPKAELDAQEWQAAMEALILVAARDGPTMFARIARVSKRGHCV
jgi:hypothetical protein